MTTTSYSASQAASVANRPVAFSAGEAAEYGYTPGARVGATSRAYCYGTIMTIANASRILVKWDSGRSEVVTWHQCAPLGYTTWAL